MDDFVPKNVEWLQPDWFLVAIACVVGVMSVGVVLRRERPWIEVIPATLLRAGVVAGVCVLLASPTTTVDTVNAGLSPTPERTFDTQSDSLPAFLQTLRRDWTAGKPPKRVMVLGDNDRTQAVATIRATGTPVRFPSSTTTNDEHEIIQRHPSFLQPGEPLILKRPTEGAIQVDGKPVAFDRDEHPLYFDSGVHVVEQLDDHGNVVHGSVVVVGDKPTLYTTLSDTGDVFADWNVVDFDVGKLADAETQSCVMIPLATLNELSTEGVSVLGRFVARGGGLMITGEGADRVRPEFLANETRNLLPARLLRDNSPPEIEDPPLVEEPGKAEIAKVSICFVLDRSYSMDQMVGKTLKSRWHIAVKGVSESLKKLSVDSRAAIMSFTLKPNWVAKPRVFLPFDTRRVTQELNDLRPDDEVAERGYNTDIYRAMKEAIDVMKDEPSSVKMIVMMTDGADRPANSRDGKKHSDLAATARANGINIVTVGIGDSFTGGDPGARAARKVITDLATKPGFRYIPGDTSEAEKAHVIFVNSVETAFKAYDDKKKKEQEDRERRRKEAEESAEENRPVNITEGAFTITMDGIGTDILGGRALPDPAPKVAWVARSIAKPDSIIAMSADEHPLLMFRRWGTGRVGFWTSGLAPDDLGGATVWQDLPRVFQQSLRWLTPRATPNPSVIASADADAIRLREVFDGSTYSLVRDGKDIPLRRTDQTLHGDYPTGTFELRETLDGESRSLGHVYVQPIPDTAVPTQRLFDDDPPLKPTEDSTEQHRVPTRRLILICVVGCLGLLPLERYIRKRK